MDLAAVSREFEAVAAEFAMTFAFSGEEPDRVLVMVSKLGLHAGALRRRLQGARGSAEALALSRAVRWHCERRVLLESGSTVVFR